jgi:hypothetical protein
MWAPNEMIKSRVFWMLILIILLLIFQFTFISPIKFGDKIKYSLKDDCGKSFKNVVLHSIVDETDCRIQCMNSCGTREREYSNSKFVKSETTCHTCECECK